MQRTPSAIDRDESSALASLAAKKEVFAAQQQLHEAKKKQIQAEFAEKRSRASSDAKATPERRPSLTRRPSGKEMAAASAGLAAVAERGSRHLRERRRRSAVAVARAEAERP